MTLTLPLGSLDPSGADVPTTFHVVASSLDGVRVPRGRAVGTNNDETCPGFVRKKYVAVPFDSNGQVQSTFRGTAMEVVELNSWQQMTMQHSISTCMRCKGKDVDHKALRWVLTDIKGQERFKCMNCSYCDGFVRVDSPDNDICEDCGCDSADHPRSPNEPLLRPQATPQANALYSPGERYKVVGTIMRKAEAMDSEKIARLSPGLEIEVLQRGTGPTGKRIRVKAEDGHEGWISVVSDTGVELLRPVNAPISSVPSRGAASKSARSAQRTAQPPPPLAELLGGNGQPVSGSIGSILGALSGNFDAPEPEDEGGLSISDLLGGSLGLNFEVLAEQEALQNEATKAAKKKDLVQEGIEDEEERLRQEERRRQQEEEEEREKQRQKEEQLRQETEKRRQEEEKRQQEEEKRRQEEERLRQEAEKRRQEEEVRRRQEEEERKRREQEEEMRRQRQEEERQRQEAEKRRQEEEERRRREKQEEEERQRQERQRRQEEEEEKQMQERHRRQEEEEEKQMHERRKRQEEEKRRQLQETDEKRTQEREQRQNEAGRQHLEDSEKVESLEDFLKRLDLEQEEETEEKKREEPRAAEESAEAPAAKEPAEAEAAVAVAQDLEENTEKVESLEDVLRRLDEEQGDENDVPREEEVDPPAARVGHPLREEQGDSGDEPREEGEAATCDPSPAGREPAHPLAEVESLEDVLRRLDEEQADDDDEPRKEEADPSPMEAPPTAASSADAAPRAAAQEDARIRAPPLVQKSDEKVDSLEDMLRRLDEEQGDDNDEPRQEEAVPASVEAARAAVAQEGTEVPGKSDDTAAKLRQSGEVESLEDVLRRLDEEQGDNNDEPRTEEVDPAAKEAGHQLAEAPAAPASAEAARAVGAQEGAGAAKLRPAEEVESLEDVLKRLDEEQSDHNDEPQKEEADRPAKEADHHVAEVESLEDIMKRLDEEQGGDNDEPRQEEAVSQEAAAAPSKNDEVESLEDIMKRLDEEQGDDNGEPSPAKETGNHVAEPAAAPASAKEEEASLAPAGAGDSNADDEAAKLRQPDKGESLMDFLEKLDEEMGGDEEPREEAPGLHAVETDHSTAEAPAAAASAPPAESPSAAGAEAHQQHALGPVVEEGGTPAVEPAADPEVKLMTGLRTRIGAQDPQSEGRRRHMHKTRQHVSEDLLPDIVEEPEESELACAARRKDLFKVQALLRDKADPNETNRVGETPLLEAAASGDLNVVALLLGHGANPAKRAPRGAQDLDAGLSPEVRLLFTMFEERKVDSEEKKALLRAMDPGAHAQVRIMLRLGVRAFPPLQNRLSPRAVLASKGTVLEFDATETHSVRLHVGDPVRPVLVLRPLGKRPAATVLMLHGLFQSGRMLERMARDLSRNLPRAQFIAPTAPTRSCYFGLGPGWCGADPSDFIEHLHEASAEITELLQGLESPELASPGRVALLGFSQGGSVATHVALKSQESFAGLLLFGTPGLDEHALSASSAWPGTRGLDVLQCHGGADTMVPAWQARAHTESLRRRGSLVHFSLYPHVGHTISQEMITEARAWLSKCLPQAAPQSAPQLSPTSAKSEGETRASRDSMDGAVTGRASIESSTHFFDIGADEDDDEVLGGGSDLEASFGFDFDAPMAKGNCNLDHAVDLASDPGDAAAADDLHAMHDNEAAADDLDAMYDFATVNQAALASRAKNLNGWDQRIGPRELDLQADSQEVQARPETTPKPILQPPLEPPAEPLEKGWGLAGAARNGDVKQVKGLLRQRADPNERDEVGATPLFAAVHSRKIEVVATLLLGKADPSLRSDCGLLAANMAQEPPIGSLLWMMLGAQVSASDQRLVFESLEESSRYLMYRLFERRGIEMAVKDMFDHEE